MGAEPLSVHTGRRQLWGSLTRRPGDQLGSKSALSQRPRPAERLPHEPAHNPTGSKPPCGGTGHRRLSQNLIRTGPPNRSGRSPPESRPQSNGNRTSRRSRIDSVTASVHSMYFTAVTKSGMRHRLAPAHGVDELLLHPPVAAFRGIDRRAGPSPRLSYRAADTPRRHSA